MFIAMLVWPSVIVYEANTRVYINKLDDVP